MNKLLKSLEKNSLPNDMLMDIYGISDKERFDCIVVAPSWTPDKVFDKKIKVKQIFSGRFANTFKIRHDNKNCLFITLQIGSPNMIDFCLLCYKVKCDNFVFIGSVGALFPNIKVGDIIVPQYTISGNGATVYLHEKLDSNHMFEKICSNKKLNKRISKSCHNNEIDILNVPVISVDSIMSEYLHLEEFRNLGAMAIDMEVATFFGCMKNIKKNASAILVVSDNSATGEHLIGRTDADKILYHAARKQVGNILLNM